MSRVYFHVAVLTSVLCVGVSFSLVHARNTPPQAESHQQVNQVRTKSFQKPDQVRAERLQQAVQNILKLMNDFEQGNMMNLLPKLMMNDANTDSIFEPFEVLSNELQNVTSGEQLLKMFEKVLPEKILNQVLFLLKQTDFTSLQPAIQTLNNMAPAFSAMLPKDLVNKANSIFSMLTQAKETLDNEHVEL